MSSVRLFLVQIWESYLYCKVDVDISVQLTLSALIYSFILVSLISCHLLFNIARWCRAATYFSDAHGCYVYELSVASSFCQDES